MSNRQGNTSSACSFVPFYLQPDVKQDHPHTSPSYLPTHNTNIRNTYTPQQHQLASGRPSIFCHAVSFRQYTGQAQDIVPEISHNGGYNHEFKRLETFNAWPLSANVRKEDLARNGFIYLDVADSVQCFFCRGIFSNWEKGDNVENAHKKHSPECAFAFGNNTGNIPLPVATSSKDIESVLRLENEKLKDQKLCKVCLDNEISMTFKPCGHLATCEECSKALAECPICRKPIKEKDRVFWS